MLVKAAPGLQVPREDMPREYITDAQAVELPETAYYLRRLAEGDLVEAQPEAPAETPAKPAKGKE